MNIINANHHKPRPAASKNAFGGTFLFELTPTWALGCDELQWMILQRRGRIDGDGHPGWRALSFIATTKAVLLRVIQEKGITPTPDGQASLNDLPSKFGSAS